jgi:AP2 domain
LPKRGNVRSSTGFSSRFRGVIHHRRSQRFEAHIWSEGKQTYLGGFDSEYEAAMAYDLAAVKFRGQGAIANFPVENYQAELHNLDSVSAWFHFGPSCSA